MKNSFDQVYLQFQHSCDAKLFEPAQITDPLEILAISASGNALILIEGFFVDGQREKVGTGETNVEAQDKSHRTVCGGVTANGTGGAGGVLEHQRKNKRKKGYPGDLSLHFQYVHLLAFPWNNIFGSFLFLRKRPNDTWRK